MCCSIKKEQMKNREKIGVRIQTNENSAMAMKEKKNYTQCIMKTPLIQLKFIIKKKKTLN